MAKLPDNFKNPFYKADGKATKIALTISPRYVSFSSGAYLVMDYAPYIIFATDEDKKDTLFIFKADDKDKGTFRIWDTQREKSVKIIRPQIAKQVAQLLGLDNSNTTWRIPGTYDEENDCLVFNGKNAIELKQKPRK